MLDSLPGRQAVDSQCWPHTGGGVFYALSRVRPYIAMFVDAYAFAALSIHFRALTKASCHGVTASVRRRSSG